MRGPDFNPQDVYTVAHALIDEAIENDTGGVIGRGGYDFCTHCDRYEFEAGAKDPNGYPHMADCPVLVAMDLLTGEG